MDTAEPAEYVQVAVLAQLGRAGGLFTYGLPRQLAPLAGPGTLVRVPFTNRQLQGVIYSLQRESDLPRVKDIAEVIDPVPVVTAHQLQLARWISDYYASPLSDVLSAMLPPGLGRDTIYILEPGAEPDGVRLDAVQREVLQAVREAGRVVMADLQRSRPDLDIERAVASLVRRGLVQRLAELSPPRVSMRQVRVASPTASGLAALQDRMTLARSPKQRTVLELVARNAPIFVPDLGHRIPGASTAVAALERKGLIQIEKRESRRSPLDGRLIPTSDAPDLSASQRSAYAEIRNSIDSRHPDIYLLHGVTGSGKTEVYLHAVARTIAQGRQAIMMVPEISLTPQAVERVAGRFPGRVAVLHSKLSPGERLDEWQRIRLGEVDVVVGPRSALFAPLPHPGLIVVDEEHDPSYKQGDASPRYNARDAAAVLGRMTGATVIFGSATPDAGTYQAAQTGRIRLLELPERPVWKTEVGAPPQSRPMPSVEIIDMRQELRSGNRSMFSNALLEALDETLGASHQALLFLNRRGSATIVLCRDCGLVLRCPHCDIPYTYHAAATRLICHRCDKRVTSPSTCPACHGPRIRYLGVGTQRVEEDVARLFPAARVLRWDRDVTGGKEAHERILRSFARHDADILVGTQMIAKGLDFPLVTLVGVISADTGLHMPDFRSPERSFQLLTQVAGRAGRSSLASKVIVQTYTPDHYAIQAARYHDYHRFYEQEMTFRRSARYPPFARLVRFVYASEQEWQCKESAENLRAILEKAIGQEGTVGAEVIGPAPCFVARIKDRYFWQVIVRSLSDPHPLLDYVPAGWSIDVDPVDLL